MAMECANHPGVETGLRCSRCEKPICTRCIVQTPVGARCRECAGVRRLPTYNVPAQFYARGIGAAMGGGIAVGIVWGIFYTITYIFFGLLAGLAVGYAIGELVSVATNRKAGPPLQVIAVSGVAVAYVVRVGFQFLEDGWTFEVLRWDAPGLIAVTLAGFIAAARLR